MNRYIFIIISSVLILSACGSKDVEENEIKVLDEKESKEEVSSKDIYFKDNVAKIEDVKVEITETKVILEGEEGNEYGEKPVFAIWYEATNFTDDEIDANIAWIAIFTAIQDNDSNMINELQMGSMPDEAHLDTQSNNIKKDGTVENSVAYELDDLETPVTLVANQGVMGDEIGREDYEIK